VRDWDIPRNADGTYTGRSVLDFLIERSQQPTEIDDDPLLTVEGNGEWLERYRREKTRLVRFQRLREQGKWVPRDEMIQCLGVFSATIRGGMMVLQREWPAAFKVMAEAFQDAAEVFERGLHNGADGRILDDPPAGSNGNGDPHRREAPGRAGSRGGTIVPVLSDRGVARAGAE
jgi:hypothetical protein